MAENDNDAAGTDWASLRDADKPASGQPDAPARTVPTEIGGPKGPEPTRYGDWEKNGRCIDF
ncbi:MAG: DUF1674 domain-containing protein [Gammaproteobacteria bacterium]|nr:DUF1674 domain-containing protein [Gammaproteobacteria bacterium]